MTGELDATLGAETTARLRQLEVEAAISERDFGNSVGPIINFGTVALRSIFSARIPLWQSQLAGGAYEELGGTGYARVSFEKQREDSELLVVLSVAGEVDAVTTFVEYGVTANGLPGEVDTQMYFAAPGTPQFVTGLTSVLAVPAGPVLLILNARIVAGAGTLLIDEPYTQGMLIFEYGSVGA